MLKYLYAAVIATLLCTPTLQAQAGAEGYNSLTLQNVLLQKGTREIMFNASYASSGSLSGGLDAEVGFGYFLQDFFEMGLSLLFNDNDFGSGYGFRVFGEYNYDTLTNWIPFAGASLGYRTLSPERFSEDVSGAEFRIFGGTKVFLTEYLALTGTLGVSAATEDVYLDDGRPEATSFDAKFGVRVWF